MVGRPFVDNYVVTGIVEEHIRTSNVIIFKKKRRHGYRRTKGFRAHMSIFKILSIKEGTTDESPAQEILSQNNLVSVNTEREPGIQKKL